ncbi:MAG TPA: hypothetical protein VN685_04970 [Rhizomicrobium sp.]|nr:hypothetical protein [Rhizomicrobium sp.]
MTMRDINKALSDIGEIRTQIAAGTSFRGYGPAAIAITGVIGIATATAQSLFLVRPDATPSLFVWSWVGAGLLSAAVVRIEMQGRSRRHHSSLADTMIAQAIEQFLPAAAACFFIPIFLLRFEPRVLWMMPGLWQLFVSLGIFASVRSLPRNMMLAGGWYFIAGFASLLLAGQNHALSPWLMGVPFLGGQLLMAAILYLSGGESDDED